MSVEDLVDVLRKLYPSSPWPKPFHLLRGWLLVQSGVPPKEAAKEVSTTARRLEDFCASGEPVTELLGAEPPDERDKRHVRRNTGGLVLGRCAELIFEKIYKDHTHTTELELQDLREGRSDTDYRLINGRGRPVYRINIKFHGSLFLRAREMVGLESHDCFALATYKIYGARQKQTEDRLPYIFVIVSVPDLSAESVGEGLPETLLEFMYRLYAAKKVSGKRDLEDRLVDALEAEGHPLFVTTRDRISNATWYVLGANRADKLLRELLFDRVFALRIPNFSRQFGRAELDMHFSLSHDLTPLTTYLDTLRDDGYPVVTTLLERGDY